MKLNKTIKEVVASIAGVAFLAFVFLTGMFAADCVFCNDNGRGNGITFVSKAEAAPMSYEWKKVAKEDGFTFYADVHNVVYLDYHDTSDGLCHVKTYKKITTPGLMEQDESIIEKVEYRFDRNVKNISRKVVTRVIVRDDDTTHPIYVDHKSDDINKVRSGKNRIDESIILAATRAYKNRIIGGHRDIYF